VRILITGAGGQLGQDLTRHCAELGDEVIDTDRQRLDVGDRDAVQGAVAGVRPDVIVNAAAWTAVDACEGDRRRAFRVNSLGPRWLREAAHRCDAHLVQLSTDYVFDGTLERPYHEWDTPNPPSVYGRSKLGGGFVDDQHGCPTFTADLAPMVRRLAVDRRAGVYHVTNQGAVSWYEFVRDVVSMAGHDPDIVEPIATADLQPVRPAPRPANSVLDNAALGESGIPLLRHYREPLAELVEQLSG
jgi:dTDP-4-dehydrorhamnose reductase